MRAGDFPEHRDPFFINTTTTPHRDPRFKPIPGELSIIDITEQQRKLIEGMEVRLQKLEHIIHNTKNTVITPATSFSRSLPAYYDRSSSESESDDEYGLLSDDEGGYSEV